VLEDVPLATLAAILIFVALRLFNVRDLAAIAHFDLFEFALAAITLLAVVLIGIEQGIAVAVGLAILDRIRLTARPQLHLLGRLPGTTSWTPIGVHPQATQVPGVLVVLFATPLWYANAVHFREEVAAALSDAPGTRVLVLDAIGMSDVDFTGTRALARVLQSCERDHIEFAVSRAGEHVVESMRRSGVAARIGEDHFFLSVDEAVRALAPGGPTGSR